MADRFVSDALRGPLVVGLLGLLVIAALPWFGPAGTPGTAPSLSPGTASLRPRVPVGVPSLSLRTPGAPVRVDAAGVNPFLHYSSQPAPMGVTDFGVWPNGTGYTYSTHEFVGVARFHNYSTYASSLGTSQSGLQLNVVVYFSAGGSTYAYWIQDVLFLTTSDGNVQFLDNIWNLTQGSGLGVYSTSVTGNGSCGCSSTQPGIYIALAGSQAGNDVNLTNPFTVELRAVATVVGGIPRVYFDYQDGYGWQTFDTALFPFATGVSDAAFRVDGTQYIMGSLYDDAELVLGGPGGGSSTSVRSGGVDLTLEYDNGRNLAAVPSAYNFGSDTAETIDHVGWTFGGGVNGTTPSGLVSYGSGNLSGLYGPASYGRLHVLAGQAPNATLWVNGTPVAYRGRAVDLSLAPGAYALTTTVNGTPVAWANVTLSGGSTTVVELPPARFTVTFRASGLPPGTLWGVRIGGGTRTTTGPVVEVEEANGSYAYALVPVPGYVAPRPPTALAVAGLPVVVDLRFWPFNFTVRFDALNLPPGTPWSVAFGTLTASGATSALDFSVPNGSYAYAVSAPNAYAPSPASGNLTVLAASAEVSIDFSLRPGFVVGVVRPMNATVLLDGEPIPVVGGSFNVSELPGTFALEAYAAGFVPQFRNVTLTPGNATSVEFNLVPASGGPTGGTPPTAAPVPLLLLAGAVIGGAGAAALIIWWATRGRGR